MKINQAGWAVLVSNRGARLIRCHAVNGRCHLEEVAEFKNPWPTPKGARPSSLSSPKSDHAYASLGHVSDEHLQKYVQDLMKWISARKREAGIGTLVIVASRRLHGLLRSAYPAPIQADIQERVGDFGRPNVNSYSGHRLFVELSGLGGNARPTEAST